MIVSKLLTADCVGEGDTIVTEDGEVHHVHTVHEFRDPYDEAVEVLAFGTDRGRLVYDPGERCEILARAVMPGVRTLATVVSLFGHGHPAGRGVEVVG